MIETETRRTCVSFNAPYYCHTLLYHHDHYFSRETKVCQKLVPSSFEHRPPVDRGGGRAARIAWDARIRRLRVGGHVPRGSGTESERRGSEGARSG